MTVDRPYLSVIVPAHQAESILPRTLGGLVASELPRESWELIVVDDASTDETMIVAAEYADTVVRLAGRPHGPAFARNRGFEASRGDVLVFVDADVVVHPDALPRLAALFVRSPEIDAAFGSYDAAPTAPGLVSQYRNLMHHYVHHRNRGPAETFWAGLGALRSAVFAEVGMFDEWHYARPQIEDIELGRRLRRFGHTIVLNPDIQGTHLKRWTLKNTLETDFRHRGVPWMWLLIQEGSPEGSKTLNVRTMEKWCTALVGLSFPALAAAAAWQARWPLAVPALALLSILASNYGFYRFLRRARGVGFALAALPLHLLYYVSNVFSVASGWLVHTLFGEPIPPAEVVAHAQFGVKTWPPPPRAPRRSLWHLPPESGSGSEGAPPA
ncbi:MAG: glycosyltransferase family 2 protein [Gemmatimonadetes bacterium]|nr:glycosyltransferase family 2 protein [Gemmatimonadota bacterium]